MKYTFSIIIAVILSLFALSCETTADASDLLDTIELVVINGYITPQDETIKIQVSKSKSRFATSSQDPEGLVVKNAIVSIKNEQETEVFLNYNSETYNYEIDAGQFTIEAGEKYSLNVLVDDNNYTSSCKIPQNRATNLQEEIVPTNDDFFSDYDFNLDFDDPANSDNFYIVGIKKTTSQSGDDFEQPLLDDINQFITDINRDGLTISFKSEIYQTLQEDDTLKIEITTVEEILYNTLRANYLNLYNEDNPFTEPIILPTNIEGKNGFGVFAGYQLTEKEVIYTED